MSVCGKGLGRELADERQKTDMQSVSQARRHTNSSSNNRMIIPADLHSILVRLPFRAGELYPRPQCLTPQMKVKAALQKDTGPVL